MKKQSLTLLICLVVSIASSLSWNMNEYATWVLIIENAIGIYFIWIGTEFIFKKIEAIKVFPKATYIKLFIIFALSYAWAFFILLAGAYLIGFFHFGYTSVVGAYHFTIGQLPNSNIELIILLPFFFYAFTRWKKSALSEEKIKTEALKYQLQTLKNQVNPHFLFNNLNSLSSIIHTDVQQADQFIKTFSEIYRYVLSKRESDLVPLSEEIKFIESYFYLQNIRDSKKVQLLVDISDFRYQIIPVSVQILVENAIKHNSATHKNPLQIILSVDANDMLVVKNNLQLKAVGWKSEKVGLENLKKQFSIILQKKVIIENTGTEYIVKLPLLKDEA